MSELPEKLDLASASIPAAQIAKLRELFPEVFTEGGKIDFDRLKRTLGETVDAGKERFSLTWPGKAECFKTIQQPSAATLRPSREESVNFDLTGNLILEGDNLEVLKLLQKSYLGQVKMIYIDPPYNTGTDFIYPDNYSESLDTYLQYTRQADSEGRKYSVNTEADGRFHSKWLNMMYPRLFLARNLLRQDGVIFISIDDHESKNLRGLCDDVFGEDNFVECFVWKRRYGGGAKEKHIVSVHEYVFMYARDKSALGEIFIGMSREQVERYYKLKDDKIDTLGPYRLQPLEPADSMADRPNLKFPITAPDGSELWPKRQWLWGKERFQKAIADGHLNFTKRDDGWVVNRKQYLRDPDGSERLTKQISIIDGIFGQQGSAELEELFGDGTIFSFPKPSGLVSLLAQLTSDDGIILDFFAGSGSTAHAILELNKQDQGNRKFILVQLPEPTGRSDYPTIADITKERVRRVIKKLNTQDDGKLTLDHGMKEDRGFRVFKLQESNFAAWNSDVPKDQSALAKQLELHVNHIVDGRTQDDLLYEILMKSGFPLSTSVETLNIADKKVFAVEGGALLVCLDAELTPAVIEAMADRQPVRVICLDAGFVGNDQLKTNAVQQMRARGVLKFQTV